MQNGRRSIVAIWSASGLFCLVFGRQLLRHAHGTAAARGQTQMWNFLEKLFSSDFMGHGYCYYWRPEIVWLHAASDSTIALAYYLIPVLLIYFVRKRRDLPFNWM